MKFEIQNELLADCFDLIADENELWNEIASEYLNNESEEM